MARPSWRHSRQTTAAVLNGLHPRSRSVNLRFVECRRSAELSGRLAAHLVAEMGMLARSPLLGDHPRDGAISLRERRAATTSRAAVRSVWRYRAPSGLDSEIARNERPHSSLQRPGLVCLHPSS
jgi:hypothetical protein